MAVGREFRCNVAGDLWGARGREFESRHSDQTDKDLASREAKSFFYEAEIYLQRMWLRGTMRHFCALQVEHQHRRPGSRAAWRELVVQRLLFVRHVHVLVLWNPLQHSRQACSADTLFTRGLNFDSAQRQSLGHRLLRGDRYHLSGARNLHFETTSVRKVDSLTSKELIMKLRFWPAAFAGSVQYPIHEAFWPAGVNVYALPWRSEGPLEFKLLRVSAVPVIVDDVRCEFRRGKGLKKCSARA